MGQKTLYLVGLPGSGKSSVGKVTAKLCGMNFVDTDEEILGEVKNDFPEISDLLTMYARIPNDDFRKYEFKVLEMLRNRNNTIIATGGGFVSYEPSLKLVKKIEHVIFIDCKVEKLEARIRKMPPRPMFQGSPIIEKLRKLKDERKEKYEDIAKYILDGNRPIDIVVDELRKIIEN